MTRKITLFTLGFIAIVALMLGVGPTQNAQAQCTANYNGVIVSATGCLEYLPFAAPTATPRPTPAPTSSAVPSADAVAATTATNDTGLAIAFTGSESRVLGYVGAALIGAGALALAAARRSEDSELE